MDGISFVMRVRNEEDTLETAIRSLFSLTINYEIRIVLHLCTDKCITLIQLCLYLDSINQK